MAYSRQGDSDRESSLILMSSAEKTKKVIALTVCNLQWIEINFPLHDISLGTMILLLSSPLWIMYKAHQWSHNSSGFCVPLQCRPYVCVKYGTMKPSICIWTEIVLSTLVVTVTDQIWDVQREHNQTIVTQQAGNFYFRMSSKCPSVHHPQICRSSVYL